MQGGNSKSQTLSQVQQEAQQKFLEDIKETFARYGDETLNIVLRYASRPQGLTRIVNELGMRTQPHRGKQIEQIARYISEHGAHKFISRMQDAMERSQAMYRHKISSNSSIAAAAESDLAEVAETHAEPQRVSNDPAWNDPAWFDAQGHYIGPERRRNNADRRTGRDRRSFIECIRNNKRFGGDRRKNLRRREDRERAYGRHK